MQNELVELQTQQTFQEQTINELNDALTSQQQQIDRLRVELKMLQEKLEEGINHVEPSLQDEKPPHY